MEFFDENKEYWKAYPYNKEYGLSLYISTFGNVKESTGIGTLKDSTIYKNKNGYLQVNKRVGKNKITKSVHVLVAETFMGYVRFNFSALTIDHIDEDKENNRVNNLQITRGDHNTMKSCSHQFKNFDPVVFCSDRNKWMVQYYKSGFVWKIGYWDTKDGAISEYRDILNNKFFNSTWRSTTKDLLCRLNKGLTDIVPVDKKLQHLEYYFYVLKKMDNEFKVKYLPNEFKKETGLSRTTQDRIISRLTSLHILCKITTANGSYLVSSI